MCSLSTKLKETTMNLTTEQKVDAYNTLYQLASSSLETTACDLAGYSELYDEPILDSDITISDAVRSKELHLETRVVLINKDGDELILARSSFYSLPFKSVTE